MNKQSLQKGRLLDQKIEAITQSLKHLDTELEAARNRKDGDITSAFSVTYTIDASDIGNEAYVKILEVIRAIKVDKLARAEQAFAAL